jgi:hypothetical protein
MAATNGPKIAGIKAENSAEKPAKKQRGNPDKIVPYQFKPGESGNPSGRPKGTTAKEMLRRQINRVVIGLDGLPSKDGITRGDLVANTVVTRAIAGDMRAAAIMFQFDQDRPIPFTQGELVPGTNVQVNVNAQAIAQVTESKESPERLEERVRAYYGLGPRRAVSVGADRAVASG